MIALFKALIPGALLTWIVSTLISSGGSSGGILNIIHFTVQHHQMYWSWPLFLAATGLAWAILWMLD
ncbi:MAG: hypothetical protein ACTHLU_01315 [Novosphingobium sp.]|jgi:hypothetical protein